MILKPKTYNLKPAPCVYLDHAATTPLDPTVATAMEPYSAGIFANASSTHSAGCAAATAVERARKQVARFLGCQSAEAIFTSGATEANNLALFGVVQPLLDAGQKPHLIISAIEHPSVAEPAAALVLRGATLSTVSASRAGYVSVSKIIAAVRPQTALISLQLVNGEIGAIQPVADVARLLVKLNKRRRAANLPAVLLHTDAVQAAPWLNCNVRRLGVDLLSLSSHKIYGPKGSGCLYVRTGIELQPLLFGGGQEGGRRSGTINVSGVVGLGAAVALLGTPAQARCRRQIALLRAATSRQLRALGFLVTGIPSRTSPGHLYLRRPGLSADVILTALDLAGIAVSAGTACAAGATVASPTLLGMGWTPAASAEGFRVTLGRNSTSADTEALIAALRRLVS
jgi:cysteine desulfurase